MAQKIRKPSRTSGTRIPDEDDPGPEQLLPLPSPPADAVPLGSAVNPDWLRAELTQGRARRRQRRTRLSRAAGDRIRLLCALFSRQLKGLAESLEIAPQRVTDVLNEGPLADPVPAKLLRCVKEMLSSVEDTPYGRSLTGAAPRTRFVVRSKHLLSGAAVAAAPLKANGERSEPLARHGLDRMKGTARTIRGSVLDLVGNFSPREELAGRSAGNPPRRVPVFTARTRGGDVTVFAQVSMYMLGRKDPKGPRFKHVIDLVTDDGTVVALLASKPFRSACKAHKKDPPRCGCALPREQRYECAACRREYNRVTTACAECKRAAADAPRFWFDITGRGWQRGLGPAILLLVVTPFASIEDISFTALHLFVDMERRAPALVAVRRRLDKRKRCLALFAQDGAFTGMEVFRHTTKGEQLSIYDRNAKRIRTGEYYLPSEVQRWRAWTRVEIRAGRCAADGCSFQELVDRAIAQFRCHAWFDLDDVVAEGFEAFWLWMTCLNGPPMSLPTTGRTFSRMADVARAAEKAMRRHAEAHLPVHRRKHWSERGMRSDAVGSDGMDAGALIQNVLNFNAGRASHRPKADECALRIVRDDLHPTLLRVAARHGGLERQLLEHMAAIREEWRHLLAPQPGQRTQQMIDFETPIPDEDQGGEP